MKAATKAIAPPNNCRSVRVGVAAIDRLAIEDNAPSAPMTMRVTPAGAGRGNGLPPNVGIVLIFGTFYFRFLTGHE